MNMEVPATTYSTKNHQSSISDCSHGKALVALTIVSTLTPNSFAQTTAAALNAELANVVVSTDSATDIVISHLRQSGKFCGLPLSSGPYQFTT